MTVNTTQPSTKSGQSRSSTFRTIQLPCELEREICEIAAFNFPKCIPNLILVAHRFRIWIEPELYRIIRFGRQNDKTIPPLYVGDDPQSGVLNKERLKVFGPHVKHILLLLQSPDRIAEILECCPNVTNLGLWLMGLTVPGSPPYVSLVPILEKIQLRRLSFDSSPFFNDYSDDDDDDYYCIPFNQPMFFKLTHLEIINSTSSWSKWKQLALLPELTHLSLVPIDINQRFINCVLRECRTLELLIIYSDQKGSLEALLETPHKDERVVFFNSVGGLTAECDEWEKGARGQKDYWIKAQIMKEHAIAARKRKGALQVDATHDRELEKSKGRTCVLTLLEVLYSTAYVHSFGRSFR